MSHVSAAQQLHDATPADAVVVQGSAQRNIRAMLAQAGALEAGYAQQAAALAPPPDPTTRRDAQNTTDPAMLGRIAGTIASDMQGVNGGAGQENGQGVHYRTMEFPAAVNAQIDRHATATGQSFGHVKNVLYRAGYADGAYFQSCSAQGMGVRFRYVLKPGVSAFDAVHAFVAGFTVADCASTAMGIQLRAVAVEMGREAFDRKFNNWKGPFIAQQVQSTPMATVASAHAPATTADAADPNVGIVRSGGKSWPVRVGDKAYMMNHKDYITLEPDGLWSGEHVLCVGMSGEGADRVPLWEGFGLSAQTAEAMMTSLCEAYTGAALRDAGYLKTHLNARNNGSNEGVLGEKLAARFKDPAGEAGLKIGSDMLYSWRIDTAKVAAATRS